MAIIFFHDLAALRTQLRGKKIIFCSGVFDLTHAGHVLFFEECKKLGDVLVVVVGDDESVRSLKGPERPVLNEHIRMKMVDALKPVDFCLLGRTPQESPFAYIEYLMKELRPDVYVVNEDAFDLESRKEFSERHGVDLRVLSRTCPLSFQNISTSSIIIKIKNYNAEI